MLPKTHRLPGYKIPTLIRSGKKYDGTLARLFLKSSGKPASEFAVIVSMNLSKKANRRNRTKRLINEALFKNLQKIKGGFEIVILAKKIFETEKLKEIEPDIKQLLLKAEIFTK